MNEKFRFRLTFNHTYQPFFDFDAHFTSFQLGDMVVNLVARDADRLRDAMRFHLEAGGFDDIATARATGERLRRSLLMLNAILNLRIVVPTEDQQRAKYAQMIKDELLENHDNVLLDSITGLHVYPDDDRHIECVPTGRADNYPNDPGYLFQQLNRIWPIDVNLNEPSEDALEILNRAVADTSIRTKFMLTFLALDRLIDKPKRAEDSQLLITQLQTHVDNSSLPLGERTSLRGALDNLRNQNLKSALRTLLRKATPSPEIDGKPAFAFLSDCIDARNALSHSAGEKHDLAHMEKEMRAFSLKLISTFNGLPPIQLAGTSRPGISRPAVRFKMTRREAPPPFKGETGGQVGGQLGAVARQLRPDMAWAIDALLEPEESLLEAGCPRGPSWNQRCGRERRISHDRPKKTAFRPWHHQR
jgi:hypothetical protein